MQTLPSVDTDGTERRLCRCPDRSPRAPSRPGPSGGNDGERRRNADDHRRGDRRRLDTGHPGPMRERSSNGSAHVGRLLIPDGVAYASGPLSGRLHARCERIGEHPNTTPGREDLAALPAATSQRGVRLWTPTAAP